ncbi:MAG: dihydropteroate synthase [Actinomycetota bacterium]|nr:dihydropteroate synthase [Actinomycetota bacterium]
MRTLRWRIGSRTLECGPRTLVMGIVNVTPDSFSDGGWFLDHEAAVAHGLSLVEDGADILDVGGESTRPGSDEVEVEDELGRVLPVIKRLAADVDVPVSIDTRKAAVAGHAIDAGASIVNDVSAGRDPGMFDLVRDAGVGLVLMHMLGEPKTMQQDPQYADVVAEVHDYLAERLQAAIDAGVPREAIALDPGLGFGKAFEHSMSLMRHNEKLLDLGAPLLVGPSRKSFIGEALDGIPVTERAEGTAGAVAWLAIHGAHIVRVHDVRQIVRVLRVIDAIRGAE